MTDNDSSKFKMRIDDESPDLQFREEIDELRVEKLSKRINRIAILIPCLVGIIILVAYFDIKKSLIKMNSSGTMEVQTLSKELESRFSSLSVKQASLEEALTKKIESLEKTTASLKATLKEATTAIKYIRSARKTDNKKLESAIAAINKTLSPIPKDLENIASNIRSVDSTFTKKLANLSQTIGSAKNDLQKIKTDLAVMVDQKALDQALKSQQKTYQLALHKLTENLEDKINFVEKKIKELQKASPSSRPGPKPVPVAKPPKETVTPKPGTIIEQDVQ